MILRQVTSFGSRYVAVSIVAYARQARCLPRGHVVAADPRSAARILRENRLGIWRDGAEVPQHDKVSA